MLKKILQEQLKELNIQKKEPLGSGMYHSVYPAKHDDNVIYKVSKLGDELDLKEIRFFAKNPRYFPKIGKYNSNYAQIEKLDTDQCHMEFDELEYVFERLRRKFTVLSDFRYLFDFFNYMGDIPKRELEMFYYKFQSEYPDEYTIFVKYKKLIDNIRVLAKKQLGKDSIDCHSQNFGYDKSGQLKMIDI